jgi:hypothetical protein
MVSRAVLIRKFHALLKEVGIEGQRENLLHGYGVDSLTELTDKQLSDLVTRLEGMKKTRYEVSDAMRRSRSVIITLLTDMEIYDPHTRDWERANAYLMEARIAGKLMYEMTLEELKALARKLRLIIQKNNSDAEAVSDDNYGV